MGLTVNYTLELAKVSRYQAKIMMQAFYRHAYSNLPFEGITSSFYCGKPKMAQDGWSWGDIEVPYLDRYGEMAQVNVHPNWVCSFHFNPGQGCESLDFAIYGYPVLVRVPNLAWSYGHRRWQNVQVNRPTLKGHNCCKTQYAGRPEYGGPIHFLKCHLIVCKALEMAKEMGIDVAVSDESGFYAHGDIADLLYQGTLTDIEALPVGWSQQLVEAGLMPFHWHEHEIDRRNLIEKQSRRRKPRVLLYRQ